MTSIVARLTGLLHRPLAILWISLSLGLLALLIDKSLYRYLSLADSERQLDVRTARIAQASGAMKVQIGRANQPDFIAREARDRLDLISNDEMVFVFNESD